MQDRSFSVFLGVIAVFLGAALGLFIHESLQEPTNYYLVESALREPEGEVAGEQIEAEPYAIYVQEFSAEPLEQDVNDVAIVSAAINSVRPFDFSDHVLVIDIEQGEFIETRHETLSVTGEAEFVVVLEGDGTYRLKITDVLGDDVRYAAHLNKSEDVIVLER